LLLLVAAMTERGMDLLGDLPSFSGGLRYALLELYCILDSRHTHRRLEQTSSTRRRYARISLKHLRAAISFWHRMATTTRMALWAESLRSAVGGVLAPHFAYDDDSGTPRTGLVNLRHVPATVRLASLSANGEITYCDLDASASF
jgi:hypothetical protein